MSPITIDTMPDDASLPNPLYCRATLGLTNPSVKPVGRRLDLIVRERLLDDAREDHLV